MKLICYSDCVYNAYDFCAKPDNVVAFQINKRYMEEIERVFCNDYISKSVVKLNRVK